MSRDIEDTILPTCRDLGIAVTAYGVLSRGLLGGHLRRDSAPADLGPFRRHSPRFAGDNLDRNLGLVDALRAWPRAQGWTTPAQLAIAWVLHQGDDIVPLVGARRPDQLADAPGRTRPRLRAGRSSPPSRRPCPAARRPATATRSRRWPTSTASAEHPAGSGSGRRAPCRAPRRDGGVTSCDMPGDSTPWAGDACSLVDAFRAKALSPVEALDACLDRHRRLAPQRLLLPRP